LCLFKFNEFYFFLASDSNSTNEIDDGEKEKGCSIGSGKSLRRVSVFV
jgi:hypothetical protein